MNKDVKRLTPRQRALYPASSKSYEEPQVSLSIKLDQDIYEWVKSVSGKHSFCGDVEETIQMALRAMRGKDHLDLTNLSYVLARITGKDPTEILHSIYWNKKTENRFRRLVIAQEFVRLLFNGYDPETFIDGRIKPEEIKIIQELVKKAGEGEKSLERPKLKVRRSVYEEGEKLKKEAEKHKGRPEDWDLADIRRDECREKGDIKGQKFWKEVGDYLKALDFCEGIEFEGVEVIEDEEDLY